MAEFSLELYRSRTAEIKAQRAEALAAYETAALASALDPASGGQLEARAVIADLDAQQEALDAAFAKFTRDADRRASEAELAKWEAALREVDEISTRVLEKVGGPLRAMIEQAEEMLSLYGDARGDLQRVCKEFRPDFSGRRPGDIVGGRYDAYRDLMGTGGEDIEQGRQAVSCLRALLAAFGNLAFYGHRSLDLARPQPEPGREAA
jgi:hypothetical protein